MRKTLPIVATLLLVASLVMARPLGTFTLGAVTRTDCATGATCNNFTVTIPGVPGSFAGELEVTSPSGSITAVDVFFSLESGTGFWGGMPNPTTLVKTTLFNPLLAAGHQLIRVRWTFGAWYNTIPQNLGQMDDACRPATVMEWVRQHHPAPCFNLIGTSNGSAAIAYAMGSFGIRPNKAIIDSGPPMMELAEGCEHAFGTTNLSYNDNARTIIDLGQGFPSNGPCKNIDFSYDTIWHANSVEAVDSWNYPAVDIHVVIGLIDEILIQQRGQDYYNLLVAHGLSAHWHPITGGGHGLYGSQQGLTAAYNILSSSPTPTPTAAPPTPTPTATPLQTRLLPPRQRKWHFNACMLNETILYHTGVHGVALRNIIL